MAQPITTRESSSLNRSARINKSLSFKVKNDDESEDESPDNRRKVRLPEIILNKLKTSKASDAFNEIPGFKNTKIRHKRCKTEK